MSVCVSVPCVLMHVFIHAPQDDAGKSTLFEVQEKCVTYIPCCIKSHAMLSIIRYVYRLGAPTSAIQLQSEETLTYLNKGECRSHNLLLVNTVQLL